VLGEPEWQPVNSSNLFILGLLLLTANLSFAALFTPARAGVAGVDRLVLLWKLLLLAAIQIGAWAIVLHQGGAAPTLAATFSRAAACFAFIAGSRESLSPPWSEMGSFIALNGLLFIPVTLLPLLKGSPLPDESSIPPAQTQPTERRAAVEVPPVPVQTSQAPQTSQVLQAPERPSKALGTDTRPAATDSTPAPAAAKPTSREEATSVEARQPQKQPQEIERGGFRPKIPKAISPNAHLSPEEELAEQMKPVGPTPPPIRFEWKN
jgi:hypothetical protein